MFRQDQVRPLPWSQLNAKETNKTAAFERPCGAVMFDRDMCTTQFSSFRGRGAQAEGHNYLIQ